MADDQALADELRDLYENAPCGYHSVAEDGMVVRMNRTELSWLGCARADLVGRRRYIDTVSARCRRAYLRAFEALGDGGEGTEIETELVRSDGTVFDALLRIAVVRDDAGRFLNTRATVIDISARKRAQTEAQRYAARLRAISHRVVEIQESERRNLSAELHDRIGPDLAAINLNLHLLRDLLPPELLAKVGPRLDDSIGLVEGTVGAVRDVAGALRPLVLDDYGLAVTLRSHAEQFSARTGIRVVVEANDPVQRLPQDAEMTLFRIGQEALTNVLKHAQADQVCITLEVGRDEVRLCVADNGCGFDARERLGHATEGLGLLIMQERLHAIDGRLRIESRHGAGTRVIASVGRKR